MCRGKNASPTPLVSVLLLDEPTIGLDAVSKLAVRDFIKRLNQERGVTVIQTTHDMDDIEALCTPVMVIGHGRILSDGNLEDLRARVTTKRRIWTLLSLHRYLISWADTVPGFVCDADVRAFPGHRY